jgi:hypothetical protein
MLQMFYQDVAYVAMDIHVCCKCMFLNISFVSNLCYKCVYLDVVVAIHIYYKHIFINVSHVSDVCAEVLHVATLAGVGSRRMQRRSPRT